MAVAGDGLLDGHRRDRLAVRREGARVTVMLGKPMGPGGISDEGAEVSGFEVAEEVSRDADEEDFHLGMAAG